MAKDPGNRKGSATQANFNSSGVFTFRDSVSGTDRKDFFKFTLTQRSSFNGKLTRLQNNADLIVTGPSGTFSSRKPGKQGENIDATLDPGEYFVQVNRRAGQTNYRLQLETSALNGPGPGPGPGPTDNNDTLTTAASISVGSTQSTINNRVDDPDPNDYFKFAVGQTGRLVLNLGSLGADANLALYRPDGTILASSNGGPSNEAIVFDVTDASLFGTYSVRVFQAGAGNNTNYSLTSVITALPDNNDSLETAAAIAVGITPTPFTNRVDDFDPNDFFKFNVTRKGQLALVLSGLTADANIALFGPAGRNLFIGSANVGTATDQINLAIADNSEFGEYKLQVFQAAGGSNTNYTMTTSLVPTDIVAGALTEASNAQIDLSTATAANPYSGIDTFVGGSDAADVYYFTVAAGDRKFLSINLQTLSGNPTLRLYKKNGSGADLLQTSDRSAVGDNEQLGGTQGEGTYFIQITDASTVGVDYNLSVSSRDATGVPSISRDINFGQSSSQARNLVNVGGTLYFFAESTELDPVSGTSQNVLALWKSDSTGTLAGTQRVKAFTGFTTGAYAVANNTLYFVANDGTGLDLWKSDGTSSGTTKVTSLRDGNDNITNLTAVGNVLYFLAPSAGGLVTDLRLWRSDGTAITTFQLDAGSASTRGLTQVGNALYYSDRDSSSPTRGQEVYRISNANTLVTPGIDDAGTLANIEALKSSLTIDFFDINTRDPQVGGGSTSSNPDDFIAVGDSLFFTAVSDFNADPNTGTVRTGERQIWRIQNSASPGGAEEFFLGDGSADPEVTNVVRAGNDLYFWGNASGSTEGVELYRLAGAATATTPPLFGSGFGPAVRVTNINTTGNSRPTDPQLVAIGSNVYFTATDGTATKLYQFNGTNVLEITNANGQPIASNINNLTVAGTQLFFTADDGVAATVGTELWQVDTAAFTYSPLDIFTGISTDPNSGITTANSSDPSELIDVGGKLFFTATDASNGTEVWSVG